MHSHKTQVTVIGDSTIDNKIWISPIDKACYQVLHELYAKRNQYDSSHPIYQACNTIYIEGKSLLAKLANVQDKKSMEELVTSLKLAYDVLESPKHPQAIEKLRTNAEKHAICKPNYWEKFTGALLVLAGVAVLGMSFAGMPFTGGMSLAGMYVGGGLLSIGGGALLFHARKKSLAKSLSKLADSAEDMQINGNLFDLEQKRKSF